MPGRQLHLLEAGLTWPLETFLVDKLEGLAARGMRITVAAVGAPRRASPQLRGVELLPQPHWDESTAQILRGVTRDSPRVGLRNPSVLWRTVECAGRETRSSNTSDPNAFVARLRSYLPLALLRPDVVHFEWNSAAIHYLPMAGLWTCPTVVSCHGSAVNVRPHLPGGGEFARALRASFDRVNAVHCVSEWTASQAIAHGADPRETWLIRPGVDASWFRPGRPRRRQGDATLRVVSVGTLRWLKGHEYAVRAIRELANLGISAVLEVIGDDPPPSVGEDGERARIEAAVERHRLTDRVALLGRLSRPEIRARLQEADVLLHMSVSEGLSVAVLEAMACGLPVVASDSGGVRDAVTDGIHGLMVPLRDPGAAASALLTLHRDPSLARRMGNAGRARVLDEFTLDRQTEAFVKFYEGVTSGRTSNPSPPKASAMERAQEASRSSIPRELRLLSVGPLDCLESVDRGTEIMRQLALRGTPCRWRIVDCGPYRDALWFARHQLDLGDRIELVGGSGQYSEHLQWADSLLAFPPADASRSVAVTDARKHGVSVLPVDDPGAIVEQLVQIRTPAVAS